MPRDAAGVPDPYSQEAIAAHQRARELPWFGSMKEVEQRLTRLRGERDAAQHRLDDALRDAAGRAAQAAQSESDKRLGEGFISVQVGSLASTVEQSVAAADRRPLAARGITRVIHPTIRHPAPWPWAVGHRQLGLRPADVVGEYRSTIEIVGAVMIQR